MASREVKLALLAVAIYDDMCDEEIPKKRRTREWIKRRGEKGVFNSLLAELRLEDTSSYRNWLRMDEEMFVKLVEQTKAFLKPRKEQLCQQVISVPERLAITLRYLATGTSLRDLSYQFRIGERTSSYIVMECCEAISKALNYTFRFPSNEAAWREISKDFSDRWNFPHCLGAVDGKHIVIQKPICGGSHYHNYKGTESIVLMAIADANLQFRYIDVGTNGRISDGGVWSKCSVSQLLEAGHLRLPKENAVQGSEMILPYVLIGDDAFPLRKYLIKPYGGSNLTREQRVYNYRLSRARRCIESAFGVMASRFRVFLRPINLQPTKVKCLVSAACSLHNFLRANTPNIYTPASMLDTENVETGEITPGEWHSDEHQSFWDLQPTLHRNATSDAKAVRDNFCKYFVSEEGSVYWQWSNM